MAVPKKRTPKSKRNMRRSHHGVSGVRLYACPKCKTPIPAHTACPTCGEYKGREVIDVLKKLSKKELKKKEKEEAKKEKQAKAA